MGGACTLHQAQIAGGPTFEVSVLMCINVQSLYQGKNGGGNIVCNVVG